MAPSAQMVPVSSHPSLRPLPRPYRTLQIKSGDIHGKISGLLPVLSSRSRTESNDASVVPTTA